MSDLLRFAFGDTIITYRMRRSYRRTSFGVIVDPLEGVVVHVPEKATEEEAAAILQRKAAWILRKLAERDEREDTRRTMEFVSGESCFYLGRQYRLHLVNRGEEFRSNVWLDGSFIMVRVTGNRADANRPQEVRNRLETWLRARARERIPERVAFYAERAGIRSPRVLIRSQHKRWGSCSDAGELRFNWQLVMAPLSLIDYVVAHEICHLRIKSHSTFFWRLVATLLPDYQQRRQRLQSSGAEFIFPP